jgi:hypothetical protein
MCGWEIDDEVRETIQEAFGLETLRVGSHVLRDYRRWKIGELRAHRLWIAQIQPTFHPAATLAMLTTDREDRAVFLIQREPAWVRFGPTVSNPAISEPVVNILQAFDLLENKEGVSLDGVRYGFLVMTSAASFFLIRQSVDPEPDGFGKGFTAYPGRRGGAKQ